jgi:site-specific DNA-adenine methylase
MRPFLYNQKNSRYERRSEIINSFPIRFGDYYEPFLTDGSIFFNLYNHGRIFRKAFLSSEDSCLVRAYTAVRYDAERVSKVLLRCIEKNSENFFNAMKHCMNSPATYIYLSRAGDEDGNWRRRDFIVRGQKIANETLTVETCSRYLNKWCDEVKVSSWEDSLTRVRENDLVYCDAPVVTVFMRNYLTALKNQRKCHVYLEGVGML